MTHLLIAFSCSNGAVFRRGNLRIFVDNQEQFGSDRSGRPVKGNEGLFTLMHRLPVGRCQENTFEVRLVFGYGRFARTADDPMPAGCPTDSPGQLGGAKSWTGGSG